MEEAVTMREIVVAVPASVGCLGVFYHPLSVYYLTSKIYQRAYLGAPLPALALLRTVLL
jgi:hypothetical protein